MNGTNPVSKSLMLILRTRAACEGMELHDQGMWLLTWPGISVVLLRRPHWLFGS